MIQHYVTINNYWRYATISIVEAPWYLFFIQWFFEKLALCAEYIPFLGWFTIQAKDQNGIYRVNAQWALIDMLFRIAWSVQSFPAWKSVSLELPYDEVDKLRSIKEYAHHVEEYDDTEDLWEKDVKIEMISHLDGFRMTCPVTKESIEGSHSAINLNRLKRKAWAKLREKK